MYTKEMVENAIKSALENKYWKEYYETAPSELCKERIALTFCYSDYGDVDGFDEERDRIESKLTLEDWRHLLKYAGNNPWAAKCRRKVKELEGAAKGKA